MSDATGELMLMAERAFKERDVLRRIVYKLQLPNNTGKTPPDILTEDELVAYKAAVVANL